MKTPLTQFIDIMKNQINNLSKEEPSYRIEGALFALKNRLIDAEELLEAEKEQMINFHIEAMKEGLIEEGDKKWSDAYLPKIREIAEQYYTKTFKSDE